jgi:hypothetical protein
MFARPERLDDLADAPVQAPAPDSTDAVCQRRDDEVLDEAERFLLRSPPGPAYLCNDLGYLRLLEGVKQSVFAEVTRAPQRLEIELPADHSREPAPLGLACLSTTSAIVTLPPGGAAYLPVTIDPRRVRYDDDKCILGCPAGPLKRGHYRVELVSDDLGRIAGDLEIR